MTTFLLTQLQRFFFKSLKVRRLPVPTVKNQQTTTFPFIVALFYPFSSTLHLATFRPFCRQFRSFLHTFIRKTSLSKVASSRKSLFRLKKNWRTVARRRSFDMSAKLFKNKEERPVLCQERCKKWQISK